MVSYFLGIEIGVIMASKKNSVKEKAIHFGIPSSRSLLKAVQGFQIKLELFLAYIEGCSM